MAWVGEAFSIFGHPWARPQLSASTGIAKACEQNLQKTLRFGGRLELPSSMELRAMLVSLQQDWDQDEWET